MNHLSTEEAKEFYEKLNQSEWLGPHLVSSRSVSPFAEGEAAQFFRRLDESIKPGKAGGTYTAPSPWHAALHLGAMCMQSRRPEWRHGRCLFRGQNAKYSSVKASISRSTSRELELEASAIFGELIRSFIRYDRSASHVRTVLTKQHLRAAAQHYGIKTDLIDFTPDPAVAVKFASDTSYEQGEVFFLDLDSAFKCGAKVIFAPPCVERLYLQLGVFLHTPNVQDIAPLCKRITFPVDARFEVIRNGKPVEIYAQQDLLHNVANLIKEKAFSGLKLPGQSEKRREMIEKLWFEEDVASYLRATADSRVSTLLSWYENVIDLSYWLFFLTDGASDLFDVETFKKVSLGNEAIFCSRIALDLEMSEQTGQPPSRLTQAMLPHLKFKDKLKPGH